MLKFILEEGMQNFNFISGTQKVLHSQPFVTMKYGTVSVSDLLHTTTEHY